MRQDIVIPIANILRNELWYNISVKVLSFKSEKGDNLARNYDTSRRLSTFRRQCPDPEEVGRHIAFRF